MASITGTFSTVKVDELPGLASPAATDGVLVGNQDLYRMPWATLLNILTAAMSVDAVDADARALISRIMQDNVTQQGEIDVLRADVDELLDTSGEGESTEVSTQTIDTAIIDYGQVNSISVGNNVSKQVHVDFTKTFTSPPVVFVMLGVQSSAVSAYGKISLVMRYQSLTTTGFDFIIANSSGAARAPSVQWIAILPTSVDVTTEVTTYDLTEAQIQSLIGLLN